MLKLITGDSPLTGWYLGARLRPSSRFEHEALGAHPGVEGDEGRQAVSSV